MKIVSKFKGVTLLEMALAMAIMAILSVSVSSLVRTGVEAQHVQMSEEMMQIVANNIVDDLRMDLWRANNATLAVSANQVQFDLEREDPSGITRTATIRYSYAGTTMTRREDFNGSTSVKTYNDVGYSDTSGSLLNVTCSNPCFRLNAISSADPLDTIAASQKIVINELSVTTRVTDNTLIGQNFGGPRFTLFDLHFDLASSKTFL